MALYLVGENLDKSKAHYAAEAGKLVQVMRGIYVDPEDDVDRTVLKHALRIAKYLYPNTYLAAASAQRLGPTRDGRLFLGSKRNQRTRIRTLEIIQTTAPRAPSVETARFDDGMGEFEVKIASLRQRFLEAFRIRSEQASSMDDEMKLDVSIRLIEKYGGPSRAADSLWALARENEWHREALSAERYLQIQPNFKTSENESDLDLNVRWHDISLGRLRHDGVEWRWRPSENTSIPLVRETIPGKLPPFIESLLPEGWLEKVLGGKDERDLLRNGKRYMSNITITEQKNGDIKIPADVLEASLANYTNHGTFTGKYQGPANGGFDKSEFEHNLARIYGNAETPRLSGVQTKVPMHLDAGGRLLLATGKPFTHILKPAGAGTFEALPLVEWMALTLGEESGLETAARALVKMPDGLPTALVVERFDIRRNKNDERMIAMEDMCSVLDVSAKAKYDGTLERVARAVRPISTEPDKDIALILKRGLFAWLIGDGDLHLKNMALLKSALPGEAHFESVRLAPLYDAVTTRVFPKLNHDYMAFKVNGKDNRLRRLDFLDFAANAGMSVSRASETMNDLKERLLVSLDRFQLPPGIDHGDMSIRLVEEALSIARARADDF